MNETPAFQASQSIEPSATNAPATKGLPNLAEHRHCEVCGRSMAMGTRVCSPECQAKFDDAVKARKRGMYMMVGLVALLLLYSLFMSGRLTA